MWMLLSGTLRHLRRSQVQIERGDGFGGPGNVILSGDAQQVPCWLCWLVPLLASGEPFPRREKIPPRTGGTFVLDQ